MFNWIVRKLNFLKLTSHGENGGYNASVNNQELLSTTVDTNLKRIKGIFSGTDDVVFRRFQIGFEEPVRAFIVFIDGMVEKTAIRENIMKPLMEARYLPETGEKIARRNISGLIREHLITIGELEEVTILQEVIDAVLSGNTALIIDGSPAALIADSRGWASRSVEEPDTEAVVRGPREGFVETLRTNTAMIRRKIKNENLKFEIMKVGRQTKTDVCVVYIKDIADDKIVGEVKRRLSSIDTDSILESGYLEEFIEDAPYSFLPTVGNCEKPDIAAAKLLEGRVAIITDGTPFVLTVPYLFVEAFQISEDYYSRPYYATIVRWLRFIAYFFSVMAPAIYVALTTYHQEMLPTPLLITMVAAREGTPFPAVVEALGMGVVYEILREAGVRLPRPVGQAISIVGALVIGEAAVSAGLVGAPVVIVVAITAISAFVVPSIADAAAVMRLIYTILAGVLGQFGIMLGIAGILTHMVSLRSFGAPYLSPVAPTNAAGLKDVFGRAPWWSMFTRPRVIGWRNPVRQKSGLMPEPPEK